MKGRLTDILSNLRSGTHEKQLIDYVKGNLSEAEKHAVQEDVQKDEFENDALEGLELLQRPMNIDNTLQSLQHSLQKQIQNRADKKNKKRIPSQFSAIVAIVLILLLAIISWVIIRNVLMQP